MRPASERDARLICEVTEGRSFVDESMITGELISVEKSAGSSGGGRYRKPKRRAHAAGDRRRRMTAGAKSFVWWNRRSGFKTADSGRRG
ncbi:hypothetical protein KCP76_15455 [Salmonella enterica subsp. enterica serovar Weltevreden]|nr:hypothetical protein KCP76_15455 [Salmonella enterica subsp. enterica serovar Weltevreden]